MQQIFRLACGVWMGAAVIASAETAAPGPVVVELYTSQGCSSCPPADALLAELAQDPRVIPLALHVDYWDYIGWEDRFAQPHFTDRQKAYARAAGSRMIYTPQMIVGGTLRVEGNDPQAVLAAIAGGASASGLELTVARAKAGRLVIRAMVRGRASAPATQPDTPPSDADLIASAAAEAVAGAMAASPGAVPEGLAEMARVATTPAAPAAPKAAAPAFPDPLKVQLVRYRPLERVEITHGENAGIAVEYHNIVTSWQLLGDWDGAAPLQLEADAPGDEPAVVIVQEPGPGAILAAARVE